MIYRTPWMDTRDMGWWGIGKSLGSVFGWGWFCHNTLEYEYDEEWYLIGRARLCVSTKPVKEAIRAPADFAGISGQLAKWARNKRLKDGRMVWWWIEVEEK